MEVFSRLEDRLIEAVKHMRDELGKLDDPPSYFDLEISVTGRVMDGELEVKFILQSGSYDKKTEGGSLENTFNEYLRRFDWSKRNAPLCLPKVPNDGEEISL
jgi:hypothetical protein